MCGPCTGSEVPCVFLLCSFLHGASFPEPSGPSLKATLQKAFGSSSVGPSPEPVVDAKCLVNRWRESLCHIYDVYVLKLLCLLDHKIDKIKHQWGVCWCVLQVTTHCAWGLTLQHRRGAILEVLCIKVIKCSHILSKIFAFWNTLNIRELHSYKACCSGSLLDSDMSVQFDMAAGASG